MSPENVNPTNFNVQSIVYNDGDFSIAFGIWENGTESLGMRWNGADDKLGYPSIFGNPMWFLVPDDLSGDFLKSLLGKPSTDKDKLMEVLKKLY